MLVVVEVMKMENIFCVEKIGVVKLVEVKVGDSLVVD